MKMKKIALAPLSLLLLASMVAPIENVRNDKAEIINPEVNEAIRYLPADFNADTAFTNNNNLPSEFGNKVGESFQIGENYYQNYDRGYCELIPTGTSYSIRNRMGRNIDQSGVRTKIALNILLEYVAADFDENGGNDDFRPPLSNPVETKEIIRTKMRDLYTEYYNQDIIIGLRSSSVKRWDGYIVQDFVYGDSNFTFGGNRYDMSFIFFNYRMTANEAEGQCFVIRQEEARYWDSNKTSLGYPTSNQMTQEVVFPGQTEKASLTFQTFEGGFLYRDQVSNAVKYRSGFVYDATDGVFIAEATPYVDSKYGSYVTEFKNADESLVVKVHQKGSVICELVNGEYIYTYRPARVYTSLTEYTWYDRDELLNEVGENFEGSYTNEQRERISLRLKQKYRNLYNAGFFVGFRESSFHGNWNGVQAQQFILGDSTANPWEGTRTNVAALVYNAERDDVVLIANNPLLLWNRGGNYNNYGDPVEDAFEVDGDVFQRFESGLLVILGNNVDTSFLFDGTYEQYLAGKESYEKPTYGQPAQKEVEVQSNTLMYALAIGVPSIVVLAGISFIVWNDNKKKKRMKESNEE